MLPPIVYEFASPTSLRGNKTNFYTNFKFQELYKELYAPWMNPALLTYVVKMQHPK